MIKLPFTEQFLWNVYNFFEGVDRAYTTLASPRTVYEVMHPDIVKFKREYERKRAKTSFRQFLYYLQKQGYIKISPTIHGRGVLLTVKGEEKVLEIKRKHQQREKRKDGKWQMIIFDIPEKYRLVRNILRSFLLDVGYQKLQHSVWVCPYEVSEETEKAVREYRVEKYVKIFLIDEF